MSDEYNYYYFTVGLECGVESNNLQVQHWHEKANELSFSKFNKKSDLMRCLTGYYFYK